jgi:cobalt/nickel transport system ATP-binding protein
MGLRQPDRGQVYFRGKVLESEEDLRELRKEVGLLFQDADDQLFSPTVLEDVAFGPLNLGYAPKEARQRALATLASLQLEELAHRVTHRLSGGEKKLISLATLLVMQPKALLLDEPTNNLDPETRERLITIINDLPLTTVTISHDWDFLAATSNEILILEHGHLHHRDISHIHKHSHIHPQGDQPHHHGEGGE